MKNVLLALVLLVSCNSSDQKKLSPKIVTTHPEIQQFLSVAKGKKMFLQLTEDLDFASVERLTASENVLIYLVKFKNNPNKIYAVSTLGSELLYSSAMKDSRNGTIGLLKNDEALTIEFKDGARTIKDISNDQFKAKYAAEFHGGSGFCQRQQGESFGECFRAECDEFCDSFVSCIALNTQPAVPILIGLACSCNA